MTRMDFLTDKYGYHYRLEVRETSLGLLTLQLYSLGFFGKRRVGNVYLVWKAERLHLDDLCIEEAYRRKGIGTALLQRIIQLARNYHAAGIDGEVTQGDLDTTSGLLDWYERNGFTITRIEPGSHPDDQKRSRIGHSQYLVQARARRGQSEPSTLRIALLRMDLSTE